MLVRSESTLTELEEKDERADSVNNKCVYTSNGRKWSTNDEKSIKSRVRERDTRKEE